MKYFKTIYIKCLNWFPWFFKNSDNTHIFWHCFLPLVRKKCHFSCSVPCLYLCLILNAVWIVLKLLKDLLSSRAFRTFLLSFYLLECHRCICPGTLVNTFCHANGPIVKAVITFKKMEERREREGKIIKFCFRRSMSIRKVKIHYLIPMLVTISEVSGKNGNRNLSRKLKGASSSHCFLCTSVKNKQTIFFNQNVVTLALTLKRCNFYVSKINSPLLNKYRNSILAH